jgi:hypothetical protein
MEMLQEGGTNRVQYDSLQPKFGFACPNDATRQVETTFLFYFHEQYSVFASSFERIG